MQYNDIITLTIAKVILVVVIVITILFKDHQHYSLLLSFRAHKRRHNRQWYGCITKFNST